MQQPSAEVPYLASVLENVEIRPRMKELPNGFGLAMWTNPARLNESCQDHLYRALVRVSTPAFGADMVPYWRGRREEGYFPRISRFCFIVEPGGKVIGWTGFHRRRFAGRPCLFLDSTGVLPAYQAQGVISKVQVRLILGELAKAPLSARYLVARTENPVIYRMLELGLGRGRVFPLRDRKTPRAIQEIGAEAAEWLGQAEIFEASSLKLVGAYSNLDALYGELPSCGDFDLDRFFRDRLTPHDAFLVIAKASFFVAVWRHLQRRMSTFGRKVGDFTGIRSSNVSE